MNMNDYKDSLVTAGIWNLYSQEWATTDEVLIYGYIEVAWLEGGEYHVFISELDSDTNIGLGFVSWHANEWGYINLDEYKTLPIVDKKIYPGW